jgi:hypothetical protein
MRFLWTGTVRTRRSIYSSHRHPKCERAADFSIVSVHTAQRQI